MRLRALLVALAAVTVAAFALGRAPVRAPRPSPARPELPAPPAAGAATPSTPVDPRDIRDVFRFAGTDVPAESPERSPAVAEGISGPSSPPAVPRLVGLVRRGGHLAVALAAEGEVVLASPGERAAGVTVLAVSEEGVRIRRADGREELLLLP